MTANHGARRAARTTVVLVGLVVLGVAIAFIWVGRSKERSTAPSRASAGMPNVSPELPQRSRNDPSARAPAAFTRAPSESPSGAIVAPASNARREEHHERVDPFEAPEEGEAPIRSLVAVGDLELGVVRGARISDEKALVRALSEVGEELAVLRRRDADGASAPSVALQEALDRHKDELARHVDGEVEVKGPGFMIGVEVGRPPVPTGPVPEDQHRAQ